MNRVFTVLLHGVLEYSERTKHLSVYFCVGVGLGVLTEEGIINQSLYLDLALLTLQNRQHEFFLTFTFRRSKAIVVLHKQNFAVTKSAAKRSELLQS